MYAICNNSILVIAMKGLVYCTPKEPKNDSNCLVFKNQIITITFFLNNYIIKTQWFQITSICRDPGKKNTNNQLHSPATLSNYIHLLNNKNTNNQTQTQEKTNPIPKNFPFIFMSLILVCKSLFLNFNSSTFFINATMIFF